jgi:uncharacterized membrane protein YeaQ/YmgE (transglycosylase-associated protein family)
MLLGIVGAVLGGFIGQAMNLYEPGQPAGYIVSILGAMLVLFLYRMATRRTTA